MYINHTARTIHCRIVYCGVVGTTLQPTFAHVRSRTPPERLTSLQSGPDGPILKSSFAFEPEGLGRIRGYATWLLLVGFETTDPAAPGCDLSGFRDVDGVVFVNRGKLPAGHQVQALRQLQSSLAQIGYDLATFPWAIQLEDGADAGTLGSVLPLGDTPVIAVDPRAGTGVFDVLKAVTRQVLVAMRDGRLRQAT